MTLSKKMLSHVLSAITIFAALISWSSPSRASIQQIVIDQTTTVNLNPLPLGSSTPGPTTSYTIYQGRIFGVLNSSDPHNTPITDIGLSSPVFTGGATSGQAQYIANFQIVTPTNPAQRSGLLIYEVSNRGGNAITQTALVQGATYVQSGWQGDLLAECSLIVAAPYPCINLNSGPYGTLNTTTGAFTAPTVPGIVSGTTNLTAYVIQVPVATADGNAPNGSNTITGPVYSHVAPGTSGTTAQLIISNSPSSGAAFTPYQPATLNTTQATLWSETSQTLGGVDTNKTIIPSTGWSWANCPSGGAGTPNPTWICLTGGATFNPNLLYEITFTAANPLVLGVGYAATRDFVSFLRFGTTAPGGGSNPVAGTVTKAMITGSSQSGAFVRGGIFYGFNQDESNRQVFEGAWPVIDGRMLWLNQRWAQPTVLLQLYMGGDESPVWWADFPNTARGLPADGLLHRCNATVPVSCPTVMEDFGELEFYGEKVGPDLTGFCVTCTTDIPLPSNVYRYFIPGTSHGGSISATSFNWTAAPSTPISGIQTYPSNPNGENFTNSALQYAFIQFLMNGTPMPPSFGGPGGTFPTLASGQLVANTAAATGFPTNIPGLPYGGIGAWPSIQYNFGPNVNYDQETGVPTIEPPVVQQVFTPYVPHVNSDGNANTGSVRSVLFQAPLGTYMGWNPIPSGTFPASSAPPYAGQQDSLSGGFWPFQLTKAARTTAGDPRPSLEERYGNHSGYVCAVTQAAVSSLEQRFLLASDVPTLIGFASNGNVLTTGFTPTAADTGIANNIQCGLTRTHNFNGDVGSDVLLRDTSGNVGMWLMSGTAISSAGVLGKVGSNWSVVGQRDFNGDGNGDLLWRDTSGNVAIWLMNGQTVQSSTVLGNVPLTWSVAATGDFNGDGMGDILWRDTSGNIAIWLMNGTSVTQAAVIGNLSTNWVSVGADAHGDIFWRNTVTGDVAMWVMNGTTVSKTVDFGVVPMNWTIAGIGDFDGNGSEDILWRDSGGNVGIWLLNGTGIFSTATLGNVPLSWSVAETGDNNGDGMSDIFWTDNTGNVGVWFMNGTAITSAKTLGNIGTTWAVQAVNAD